MNRILFGVLNIALFVAFSSQQLTTSDTITITAIVRDVWPCANLDQCGKNGISPQINCDPAKCNPGFEWEGSTDHTITLDYLNADRKPIYNNAVPHNTFPPTGNVTSWPYWWYSVEGYNIAIPVNITLSNNVCGNNCDGRTYGYENSNFYPINNQGFGNYYNNRNYHFAMELHTKFTYKGDEIFEFRGDDDLWVYINNRKVIDLGGIHTQLEASVQLNQTNIGLIVNKTYDFDLFFAERHTVDSNFKMFTSIELRCPYYDHCGACQGDGQSCCNFCNDNSVCTTEKCAVLNKTCIYTPVTCPGDYNDRCHIPKCNAVTGCYIEDVICDDGNACTTDVCNPASGCSYLPVTCNDGSSCTDDSCNKSSGCVYTPIPVNKCTLEACGVKRDEPLLLGRVTNCVANDTCFPVECINSTCVHTTPVNCNDNNNCTIDTCHDGNCTNTPVDCDDGNVCTTEYCAPNGKCVYSNITCNDGDACTTDLCNATTGCYNITTEFPPAPNCYTQYCDNVLGNVISPVECRPADKCKCNPSSGECECQSFFQIYAKAAKITGGVLAGIIVGAAAFAAIVGISSKKGYDYYKLKSAIDTGSVASNPLYVEKGGAGINPLFVAD